MGVFLVSRGVWLAIPLFACLFVSCGSEEHERCVGNIEGEVAWLRDHPNDADKSLCLLDELEAANPDRLCTIDRDKNGRVAAEDVLQLLKSRISQASSEKPIYDLRRGYRSYSEIALWNVGSKCPEWQSEASFVQLMFKVGRAAPAFSDYLSLPKALKDPQGLDINKIVVPLLGLLDPDMPCAEAGLPQCGKDISESVVAMGDGIKGTYEIRDVKVVRGTTSIDISGTYNETTFRLLAATGELVNGIMYFLSAHFDFSSILHTVLDKDSDLDFNTAGQALASLDSIDSLFVKTFDRPVIHSGASEQLAVSREAFQRAIRWLIDDPITHSNILTSLPYQGAEGLGVRFIDNGDGRVGGCDQIQVNLGFGNAVFSDYYAEGPKSGCTGPLQPNSFQLPATASEGRPVNYEAMFAGAVAALSKFSRSVTDPSIAFSFEDINLFLNQVGGKSLPKVMEFYPGELFKRGLSMLTPYTTGMDKDVRASIEMEVNQSTPPCPENKTSKGAWICKNKKGDKDQSAYIVRGDSDHFNNHVSKDGLFVSEAILDQYGLGPKTFFRAAEGGGFLPYIEFKNPDLKGFMKVDEGLISSMTDPNTPICDREMGNALTGRMVPTDNRFLNALLNFAILEAKLCGNSSLKKVGNAFSCSDVLFPLSPGCESDWACESDVGCGLGDFDWGCSPDLSFDCEMDDFVPSCDADDFSCRQMVPIASARGIGILANGVLNVGIVLLPLLLWPLRRRRGR